MSNNECTKCIHHPVCKTAESCDGYVSGCEHFKEQKQVRMDVREKLVELFAVTSLEFEDAVTLADHLIANGVTVQEWISVEDRLPEKGTGNVLVVKQFRGKSYVDMGEVIGETACCYSDEYCINPREHIFTHWMPLPQPPKGE